MLNPVFARKLDDGGPECMHWFNCYGCARLGDDCDGSEAIYDLEEGDKVYFGRHFRNGSDEPMVWDVLKVDGQKGNPDYHYLPRLSRQLGALQYPPLAEQRFPD